MPETHDPNTMVVAQHVADVLTELHQHFKPGVKITIFARYPGEPDKDFCLSSEPDPREFLKAAQARFERGNEGPVPDDVIGTAPID